MYKSVCISLLVFATMMLSTTSVYGQNSKSTETAIDDNELGMGILFDMVNIFLGDVLHKKKITESFLNLSLVFEDGVFHSEEVDDWRKWMEYLIGFSVCAAIGIVFIVAMPIIGLIFCCCRLCGRCGAKSEKYSSKRAKCKRRSYCTILLLLTTVALAGNVCAFICNSLIYKHLQNDNNEGTFGIVNSSFKNIEKFINNSASGYGDYMINTYDSTSSEILTRVNTSATEAVDIVLNQLHANELLANATEIGTEANEIKQDLDQISSLLLELRNESNELRDSLKEISSDISSVCSSSSSSCQNFNSSEYDTQADFSSLSTLSEESNKVAEALNMKKYIDLAKQSLVDAKDRAHKDIEKTINDAEKAIEDVRKQIGNANDDLQHKKDNLLKDNFPGIYSKLTDASNDVEKYISKVYYGCIGVCCAYLLIIVLYYVGLLLGMCGEKPGDDAPCCNTGKGANFLISGVAFTFIFSWILMIICTVLFCVGGPVYTEACRFFQGHNTDQLKGFDGLINNAMNLKSYYNQAPPDLSLSGILQNCQKDEALFSALQLNYIVNLNKVLDISQLDAKIKDLKTIKFNSANITISESLNGVLTNLSDAGLDRIDFTKYKTELSKQLTVGNLSVLSSTVRTYASQESNLTAKNILNECATRLQNLSDTSLPRINSKVAQLSAALNVLEQKSTITQIITALIIKLGAAESDFNTNKDNYISTQIYNLADNVLNYTSRRIDEIKLEVNGTLYPCQNLSSAVYAISDALCLQVVEPVNGLWFSFGWCLFFFVPCLIFAILLAGQYRRTLEDDKEFDDPNYMMYGGPNPDTIPLTSVDRSSGSSAYPRSGMFNAGYRDENRRGTKTEPPPYDAQMHSAWHGNIPRPHTSSSYNDYNRNVY